MNDEIRLDFAPLRHRRRLLGVSQRALAPLCGGCHPSLISHWERNARMPSALQLVRLARALGTPTFMLFDVIEPKEKK